MITRLGFLQKLKTISVEQFQNHWKGEHSSIASQLPGIIQYRQNHIVDKIIVENEFDIKSKEIHGISQIWYEDAEVMKASFSSEIIKTLYEDEKKFIHKLNVFTFKEKILKSPLQPENYNKVFVVLNRDEQLEISKFEEAIQTTCTDALLEIPNLEGIVRFDLLDREVKREDPSLFVDAVFEMLFDEQNHSGEFFESETNQKMLEILNPYCKKIAINFVKTYVIVENNTVFNRNS